MGASIASNRIASVKAWGGLDTPSLAYTVGSLHHGTLYKATHAFGRGWRSI